MNEFDFEVLQRKRIAQQARRKKSGRTAKVTLSSDRLTPKQWRERNGEVMKYDLSKPMDWESFKGLPVDIQGEYIANLREKHGGTIARICGDLFHIGTKTFRNHLAVAGLAIEFPNIRFADDVHAARKKAWEQFMAPEPEAVFPAPEPEEAPEEAAPPVEEEASTAPERKATMRFDSITLNFSGPFDRETLCNSLAAILQNGQRVKLTITCEMEGD